MKTKSVHQQKQKLDNLFDYIKSLRSLNDLQLEAFWACFLCVRVCGFIETSVRVIYSSYSQEKAHPNIARYVGNALDANRSQNMKPENLLALAGSFNPEWRKELENYIADKGRKEAIESVVNIRNSIAHGGTQSISYHNIQEYYKSILEVIEFIELQCD